MDTENDGDAIMIMHGCESTMEKGYMWKDDIIGEEVVMVNSNLKCGKMPGIDV